MKNKFSILIIIIALVASGCNDWLDVRPKDLQYTADYWKSKEDVEAVLASGYSDMRSINNRLLVLSELRGASMFSTNTDEAKVQNFQLTIDNGFANWRAFYQVINMANSVLKYAPEVQKTDQTYSQGAMLSHQTEAYFMRGLMYFYLLRNWREVPLVLEPYIDDSAPFSIAKSKEADIITQIKKDIKTALESDAAKERFEDDQWLGASKGRATQWALYALMADVCLWNEDYDECITYANLLINASAAWRPVFMTNPEQWFEIFDPGNSNESIFEINWTKNQTSGSPYSFFTMAVNAIRKFSPAMSQRLSDEATEVVLRGQTPVRSRYGAYNPVTESSEQLTYPVYKYQGSITNGTNRSSESAANMIIYRMADIMLLKAEALIWKGGTAQWQQSMDIINQIRVRANLDSINVDFAQVNELPMLEIVLNERDMELAAEGKRWYDVLRFARAKNYLYKEEFIKLIIENNSTANRNWLRSALRNDWAWYLPVSASEMETNELLTQNPYYGR